MDLLLLLLLNLVHLANTLHALRLRLGDLPLLLLLNLAVTKDAGVDLRLLLLLNLVFRKRQGTCRQR